MFLENKGYCPCCGQETIFKSGHEWLRDHYLCTKCGCKPRERALMSVVEENYPNWRELTIHESSPMDRGASVKFKKECSNYIPSQFWPERKMGKYYEGFYNVDLEKEHFHKNIFDLVITQDVFEHIYHPDKACKQIHRTLKKGGAHICTIPLVNKNNPTEKWSIIKNGEIIWLKEPEYHGNPVDDDGAPVSYHYGYDLCSLVEEWSDFKCQIESIDDLERGIRAEYNEIIIMMKE
jgi:SAM-dependent methyltransferase